MHNGEPIESIPAGDNWLQQNLDGYYQWSKTHNSLLILTFDENDDRGNYYGLTNPLVRPDPRYSPRYNRLLSDIKNRIVTIFAGAHITGKVRRRQRHHTREHPSHDRSYVWVAQFRRATAKRSGGWHYR
jgi:hypothetical protein